MNSPAAAAPRKGRRTNAERRLTAEREIVDAAIALLSEKSPSEITLAEVGERAGYSRAQPAYYFGSKEGLWTAVLNQLAAIIEHHTAALSGAPEDNLDSLLRAAVFVSRTVTEQMRLGTLVLLRSYNSRLSSAPYATAFGDVATKANHRLTAALADKIRSGVAKGYVNPGVDAEATAILIMAAQRGILIQQISDPKRLDLPRLQQQLATMIRRTLEMSPDFQAKPPP